MTKPLPIIIDTDPGQDDAVAILLALASPEFEVLGITAVAGNVPLALTEINARKICELAGRPDIKVFAGAARPILRPLVTAEHVHGQTGLDGPVWPDPKMPLQKQHAVDFIVETLMTHEAGTITLCVLGPMTNIALALIREPRIASRIKRIVAMGGGYFEGGKYYACGGIQYLCGPACGARRVSSGHSHDAYSAGLHAPGLVHRGAHRKVPRDQEQARARHRGDAVFLRTL